MYTSRWLWISAVIAAVAITALIIYAVITWCDGAALRSILAAGTGTAAAVTIGGVHNRRQERRQRSTMVDAAVRRLTEP